MDTLRTLQTEMTNKLGSDYLAKAERSVKRADMPARVKLNALIRKGNANCLDRLRYLCEAANAKPTEAKLLTAKTALLQFIGKHTNPHAQSIALSREDFELLGESYYGLSLAKASGWQTPGKVYDTCLSKHEADNWRNLLQRWC